jgi:7-cyano-7-deazaguanine reductase
MKNDVISGITLLGKGETNYPTEYSPALLETFDNKFPGRDYFVEFNCPEFTCLCPITGQPDFAKITVKYIPNVKMVESKSLKLYLFSFRNHGGFHEESVNIILRDLVNLMSPKYIEVLGEFTPRGGISIHPFVNYGIDEKWQEFALRRMEKY